MNKVYRFLIRLRSDILVFLTHNMALPVLRFIRKPKIFPYTKEQLLHFPSGTLGKDIIIFLEEKKFLYFGGF